MMPGIRDESIRDIVWWFNPWAEMGDFVDISHDRVLRLAAALNGRVSMFVINRLLAANGLPHGPTNATEQ